MVVPGKRAGIKEIAEALEVSIGTVDRALHGRPGINPVTRARVLKMAETLGYRPNLAARYLKSGRQFRFLVALPAHIEAFFDALREGIAEAAAPFAPGISVEFRSHPRLGVGDAELIAAALEEDWQGIIVAPGSPAELKPLIRKAARKSVPVVCVATDAPGTDRLTAVSTDPFTSGAMAGELLGRLLPAPAALAVVTGQLSTVDHLDKLEGFRTTLTRLSPRPVEVIESHDDSEEAYRQSLDLLRSHAGLGGIYVSTANSIPVLRAVEESGRGPDLAIVTTDLFPELVPYIRAGRVLATMYQRPVSQGRMAFHALYQFVVENKCPPPRIRLAPHIVMQSSLDFFLERLPAWDDPPTRHPVS